MTDTISDGIERTRSQLIAERLAELRSALDDLEQGVLDRDPESPTHRRRGRFTVFELIELSRRKHRIGYPTSSLGGGGSRPARDEDGEPLPNYSDPVGGAVAAELDPGGNPYRQPAADVDRHLREARRHLGAAVTVLADLTPKPKPDRDLEPGCRSCARLGKYAPVSRGDLCRWCADFDYKHRTAPPPRILAMHHRGMRITQRMINDALAPNARTNRRSRRKGRARR